MIQPWRLIVSQLLWISHFSNSPCADSVILSHEMTVWLIPDPLVVTQLHLIWLWAKMGGWNDSFFVGATGIVAKGAMGKCAGKHGRAVAQIHLRRYRPASDSVVLFVKHLPSPPLWGY